MKTFFSFSASLLAGVSLMSAVASADAIKPGCIGGCMGSAIPAPTPVFPADYKCRTGWPFQSVAGSCTVDINVIGNGGATLQRTFIGKDGKSHTGFTH